MSYDFLALLPDGVTPLIALAIIATSFIASLLTATLSLGGGILMLSALSLIFPPAVVIPVHGVVQLGSNSGRAFLNRAHIQWDVVLWISLGAMLGAALGGQFASMLSEDMFRLLIGFFILFMIWLPRPDIRARGPAESFIGGTLISFLGMVVGVTGPLVMTFIRAIGERHALVATHATLMTFQNSAKVVAFMAYGFVFYDYLALMAALVVAGFGGTAVGTMFLGKLPERAFRAGFKVVITVIALDLIRRSQPFF